MSDKISFKFEELKYQNDAVNAVVDLLDGLDRYTVSSLYSNQGVRPGFSRPEANVRFAAGARLLENLNRVQYRNDLFKDAELAGNIPQFSVEMETGTGKTFVYLKTILSLWQTYGGQFKKFIIVVPSNPILLGVKKSIEMLSEHFKPEFRNIDIARHSFVYDRSCRVETVSGKLVESTDLSVMLVTYHSFNKDTNRLRTENEYGVNVWEDIKDIAPIVIIDEPQKLDGTGRKKSRALEAIEELEPLMILRYSATHRNLYNPVYKLDSYQAYRERLVKGIKVKTVHSLTPKEFPYVRFLGLTPDLKARIEIFSCKRGGATRAERFDVLSNASLEELSGGLPQYHNWYIAGQPNKLRPLEISREDGTVLYLEKGKSNDEPPPEVSAEMQMKIAINAHINKQIEILNSGRRIKALALFFVDSVAKVRGDVPDGRGEYLVMFDRLFEEIRRKIMLRPGVRAAYEKYPRELAFLDPDTPAAALREGYFAIDKNRKAVEIDKWDSSAADEDIEFDAKTQENIDRGIDLILNKKDELISFDEPLMFIFSHSALREGWDNPNVFTLVTIKQGSSDIAKKQEIGRGLRLPVDESGVRCRIDGINELTVVANDYYDQFAEALQEDYNRSTGFNKNEVSADIIKQTLIRAGVPAERIEAACGALRREITAFGVVKADKSGKLILTENADRIYDLAFADDTLAEHSLKIVEAFSALMIEKGTRKIAVANGDEEPLPNDFQKYFHEEDFNRLYRKMLEILQKRSIYRYELDKDAFIADVGAELDRLLSGKTDRLLFEVTDVRVDFNEARRIEMKDAQTSVREDTSNGIVYERRSTFDIVNYIMYRTMLPRLAIVRIIDLLGPKARERINNQDNLEDAAELIKEKLVRYKSRELIKAELIDGVSAGEEQIFEVDKIINEAQVRHLFTPSPENRRALNLRYKFDSDGECRFARALDEDTRVLMWTKLKKGGFVIETPVGNYSPDWAVVYQNDGEDICMYFIAETKWDKTARDLTETEKIKIQCAVKHFEAVNDSLPEKIMYKWVNAYNDPDSANSFPQVFTGSVRADTQ